MSFFLVSRQRTIIECFLVEAATEAEARKQDLKTARCLKEDNMAVVEGSMLVMPYDGLNCEPGEQVFEVLVVERHLQPVLINAETPEKAIEKVREGDGIYEVTSGYDDTEEHGMWQVRDMKGENLVV